LAAAVADAWTPVGSAARMSAARWGRVDVGDHAGASLTAAFALTL
jgi:hypothetical protein